MFCKRYYWTSNLLELNIIFILHTFIILASNYILSEIYVNEDRMIMSKIVGVIYFLNQNLKINIVCEHSGRAPPPVTDLEGPVKMKGQSEKHPQVACQAL